MAWTSPRTWVAGELVTAAIMNTYIRDNQQAIVASTGAYVNAVTGPHAIGGSTLGYVRLGLTGAFANTAGASTVTYGTYMSGALTGHSGDSAALVGTKMNNSIVTAGTCAMVAQLWVSEPQITVGGGTATGSATVYIEGPATEATNNYALFVDAGVSRFDGNVQIGDPTSAHGNLYVADDTDVRLLLDQASTNTTGSLLFMRKTRGTNASKSIVVSGDQIGTISFNAYDGSTHRAAAQVIAAVDGTPGSSDMPGSLTFLTTPDGSATPSERLKITSTGSVTISGTGPHVIGGATNDYTRLRLLGNFTSGGAGTTAFGVAVVGTITGAQNDSAAIAGMNLDTSITTAGTNGSCTIISQLFVAEPKIIVGSGTVANSATVYIEAAATEATNNYALWVAAGNAQFEGDIGIGNKLYHVGDTDTNLDFGTDAVTLTVGNVNIMKVIEDDSQDYVAFNEDAADVDFRVEGVGQVNALFVQGSDGMVGIGTGTPTQKLHVSGGNVLLSAGQDIRWDNSGNYAVGSNSNLTFTTNGNERMRITGTTGGIVLVGHTASLGQGRAFQLIGDHQDEGAAEFFVYNNSTKAPSLGMTKSRGTIGVNTIVQDGDILGRVDFFGADGSNVGNYGGSMVCTVDGSPASGNIPGKLTFNTTEDGGSATERLKIDNIGSVTISGAGPHAIGGATDGYSAFSLRTVFTSDGSSSVARGFDTDRMTVAGFAGGGDTTHIVGALFSAAMTVPDVLQTYTDVAQVMIDEPAITKVGGGAAQATITNASTLKITGAPNEATNNYALWVDSGATKLDGTLTVDDDVNCDSGTLFVDASADAVGFGLTAPTAQIHVKKTGDNAYMLMESTVSSGASQIDFSGNPDATGHTMMLLRGLDDTTLVGQIEFERDASGANSSAFTVHTKETSGSVTERVRVTAAGLVGIGVTPVARLHVKDTGSSDVETIEGPSTGLISRIQHSGHIWRAPHLRANGDLRFYNQTDDRYTLTLTEAGLVGIGTNSPDTILDLESAADAPTLTIHSTIATGGGVKTGGILSMQMQGGTGEPSETNDLPGSIAFVGQANDYQFSSGYINSIVETGGNIGRSDMIAGLSFYTKTSGAAGAAERMRITGAGDVGISNKLFHLGDTDTNLAFGTDTATLTVGNANIMKIVEDGSQDLVIFNEDGTDIDFRVESLNKQVFNVNGAGDNIGIGFLQTDNGAALVAIENSSNKSCLTVHQTTAAEAAVRIDGGSTNTVTNLLCRDSAGSTLLQVRNNGMVGIGVTAPASALHVATAVPAGSGAMSGVHFASTVTGTAGNDIHGIKLSSILTEAGSGVHANIDGMLIDIEVDDHAGSTATNVTGLHIPTFACTGTTNATGLRVYAPTGATNNVGIYTNGNVGIGTATPGTAVAATGMVHSINCIRAWGKVNAESTGIPVLAANSFNIAGVDDDGEGITGVRFTTALPHANYVVVIGFCDDHPKLGFIQNETTAGFDVKTTQLDGALDDLQWTFAVISD